jgi:HK97 family phage prohead protease
MNLNHKHFPLALEVKDDGARTIEGLASVFHNVDDGNDVVLPGAFTKSIHLRKPMMLWQHKHEQVIGVWDEVRETKEGLFVKGRILETQLGNDASTLVKAGAITGLSIGYETKDSSRDRATGARQLKELSLYEVSFVTFPMNDRAAVTGVKSASQEIDDAYDLLERAAGICDACKSGEAEVTAATLDTVSQLTRQAMCLLGDEDEDQPDEEGKSRPTPKSIERSLREAGLTRSQAKGLLAKGYTAIAPQREAAADTELARLFTQFTL